MRRWYAPVLLAALAVGLVIFLAPKAKAAQIKYDAKTVLIVNPSSNQSSSVNLQEAALETTVGAVPKAAAALLQYKGNPVDLASQVTVTSDTSVGTLTLDVTGTDGNRAAAIANAFATALNQSLTTTAVNNYNAQVSSIQSRLSSLQAQVRQYQGYTDPISEAKLGSAEDQYRLAYDQFQQLAAQGQPVQPFNVLQKAVPVASGGYTPPTSRTSRMAIGGAVGFLIGLGIAIGLDMLWPKINDRNEAEREFGTVVLAEVPKLSKRERRARRQHGSDSHRMAAFREAYRMLRTSILLLGSSQGGAEAPSGEGQMLVRGPQVILVTSPLPREGKSTSVASLASSMAETGRTVLICNADFRAPSVHRAFGLDPGPGLTDLLSGTGAATRLSDLVHPTSVPGVSLVHSGTRVEDAAELVARRGAQLLEEARGLADVVLVDTAPLLVVSDASELLPSVDAVVMVARTGQTSRDSARRSFELLERAAIPVLGLVLVGSKSPTSYYYSGRYEGTSSRGWRGWLDRLKGSREVVAAGTEGRRVLPGPVGGVDQQPPAHNEEQIHQSSRGLAAVNGKRSKTPVPTSERSPSSDL